MRITSLRLAVKVVCPVLLLVAAAPAPALGTAPGQAKPSGSPTSTAPFTSPVGNSPIGDVVNPRTHTLYVANIGDNTVSVINTRKCNAKVLTSCEKTAPTVAAGDGPYAPVVDEATDTLYVPDANGHTVSVIDGATCNAETVTGCGQTPRSIRVGKYPADLVLDPATKTLYVSNFGNGTVSVVNAATCNARNHSGCTRHPTTVTFGKVQPSGLLLDRAAHTLYVANEAVTKQDPTERDTINLINTATCNARVKTGCHALHSSITVGLASSEANVALAVDHRTQTMYVANEVDGTVSVVNIKRCTAANTTGCSRHPFAAQAAGGGTTGLVISSATRTLYEVNQGDNVVSVVALATCHAGSSRGCSHPVGALRVGIGAQIGALDPSTGTLYVTSGYGHGSVSAMNAAACNAAVVRGCSAFPPTASVGNDPDGIAIDSATHTAYVTNGGDNTVSVIDTAQCNAATPRRCQAEPATVAVGVDPGIIVVDPTTNTIYVTNYGDGTHPGTVSVIDGATCDAETTTGCGQAPPTVTVGVGPFGISLDSASHTAYVGNYVDNTVSLIDTATCDATDTSGCGLTPATATAGVGSSWITLDPSTHTAYVANTGADTVSVLDTQTCNATVSTSCATAKPTLATGGFPTEMSLDSSTGALYVSDQTGHAVAVLDTAACSSVDTAGCGGRPGMIEAGEEVFGTALDPGSHTLYVSNLSGNTVSEINTRTCGVVLAASCHLEAHSVVAGNGPGAIAVDLADHTVYVANGFANGLDNDLSMLKTP